MLMLDLQVGMFQKLQRAFQSKCSVAFFFTISLILGSAYDIVIQMTVETSSATETTLLKLLRLDSNLHINFKSLKSKTTKYTCFLLLEFMLLKTNIG